MPALELHHRQYLIWQLFLWEMEFLIRYSRAGDRVVIGSMGPPQYACRFLKLAATFPKLQFVVVDFTSGQLKNLPFSDLANLQIEIREFNGGEPSKQRQLLISNTVRRFSDFALNSPESIAENLKLHTAWCASMNVAAALIPFTIPNGQVLFYDLPIYAARFVKTNQRRIAWTPGDHVKRIFGENLHAIIPSESSNPQSSDTCACAGCKHLRELEAEIEVVQ